MHLDGQVYTQEDVDQTISEHKCQVAKFYHRMAEYRRRELLCKGFTVKDSAKNGLEDMVFVPSPAGTIILDGTDPRQRGELWPNPLGKSKSTVLHFEGTVTAFFAAYPGQQTGVLRNINCTPSILAETSV